MALGLPDDAAAFLEEGISYCSGGGGGGEDDEETPKRRKSKGQPKGLAKLRAAKATIMEKRSQTEPENGGTPVT